MSDPVDYRPNIVQNLEADLLTLFDLYQGHDTVHPDRSECGGVGVCLMMRTENTAEHELVDTLRELARSGRRLRLQLQVTS